MLIRVKNSSINYLKVSISHRPAYSTIKINEGFCVSKLNVRNSYLIKGVMFAIFLSTYTFFHKFLGYPA